MQKIKKKLKGTLWDYNTSLRVVHAALKIKYDFLVEKQKKENKQSGPKIQQQVCDLFRISSAAYTKIVKAFLFNTDYKERGYDSKVRGHFEKKG